ncbi:CRTAC1 family protein [Reichenbachiella carrageenanivorans]|uniref:CRTAC1 family protein n=1 Tax=Reichenbachiella carrageenanivorans TaxID=2979869 RepID=A0ABY6CVC4_9BACT|nr:CRTAC1 family protein [Reichenbachiella carrageenanivorans]UXX77857.1 CRTAC1 family protein [Reichenbachiella carrageenanivorans]
MKNLIQLTLILNLFLVGCQSGAPETSQAIDLKDDMTPLAPVMVDTDGVYVAVFDISSLNGNARMSLFSNKKLLLDHLSIPDSGSFHYEVILGVLSAGQYQFEVQKIGGNLRLEGFQLKKYEGLILPHFTDISAKAGFETPDTWKYGGPSIADVNNDGYYDFILNNHDKVPAQLFWNLGNGQVRENDEPLRQWDVHGTAAGDYDGDGDLDIVIAQGGGNGNDPQPPHLLRNDNGVFTRVSEEVGITDGARGRSVRWIDMDLDGDLDFLMINAQGISGETGPKNFVYQNMGDGTFQYQPSPKIEQAEGERLVVTDLNNDRIDDLILYTTHTALSVWLGQGDFNFTNVSESWLPEDLRDIKSVAGATNIDYDNDGDLDLYLARGKVYYDLANRSLDFDPIAQRVDLREEGNKGTRSMTMTAQGALTLSDFFHWSRGYKGDFPVFLGEQKTAIPTPTDDAVSITRDMAVGWPADRTENGWYLGYLGDDKWQMEWVKNDPIFWGIRASVTGASSVSTDWTPQNHHVQDILLRNDGDRLVDVTEEAHLPLGGNHQGATIADFNNDGYMDLFVYRFGMLRKRVEDLLLLNTGEGTFIQVANHGAHDLNDQGHGDMGQAFDFDLDGRVDLLNGSDNPGRWYLYQNNTKEGLGHFALVQVGYSPESNVDPISAEVEIVIASGKQKRRVGSAGEIHSQSLLNTIHFGLGQEQVIDQITVTWRNGEQKTITNTLADELVKF